METDTLWALLDERQWKGSFMEPGRRSALASIRALRQCRAELTALEEENTAMREMGQELLRRVVGMPKFINQPERDVVIRAKEIFATPPTNPNAGLLCKDVHPNGCPFIDLPEDHTIGDHPNMKAPPPTGTALMTRDELRWIDKLLHHQCPLEIEDASRMIKAKLAALKD